jgi:peptide/nickel transport system substrate-binding protein
MAATGTTVAQAQSTLRIAMTVGAVPDWRGQPDQGFEGNRFVGFSLYDTMILWDLSSSDKEAGLKPGLATKWWMDPADNKRWYFDLRQGVKYHDGCTWNAESAVWNFERLVSDKHPAFTPYNFARARARTNNIVKVEKTGDYQVAFTLKDPESLFHFNMPYLFMISNCAVEKAGNNLDVYAKAPSGTGPYRFVSAIANERMELTKNTDYWDQKRVPKHDRLVLLPMPEATTRVAALLSGQVDFIEAPPPDALPALKAAKMQIVTNVYPHTWPYILNNARGPFKDIRVRHAANWAVNRGDMVELLSGLATPSSGIYTPKQSFYGKPKEYGFDPKRATALLKEAGCYPCDIRVAISTSGSGQMHPLPMNELIKEQLEAVGFKVRFDTLDWNALLDVFFKGQERFPYDAINFSSGASDPLNVIKGVMTKFKAPLGSNWGWFSSPDVDDIAEKILQARTEEEWGPLIPKLHELVVRDARNLFIVSDLNPRAMSPRVKGFVQAQSWFQDLTPIVVAPR